jgi:hypothetical protein
VTLSPGQAYETVTITIGALEPVPLIRGGSYRLEGFPPSGEMVVDGSMSYVLGGCHQGGCASLALDWACMRPSDRYDCTANLRVSSPGIVSFDASALGAGAYVFSLTASEGEEDRLRT